MISENEEVAVAYSSFYSAIFRAVSSATLVFFRANCIENAPRSAMIFGYEDEGVARPGTKMQIVSTRREPSILSLSTFSRNATKALFKSLIYFETRNNPLYL